MAQAAAAADNGNNAAAGQARSPSFMDHISGMLRMFLIFQVVRYFLAPKAPTPTVNPETGEPAFTSHAALWTPNQAFDLRAYITESPEFNDYKNDSLLVWLEEDCKLDWTESRALNLTIPTTPHLLNNGSLYLHAYFTQSGYSPDPDDENYELTATAYRYTALNTYKPKPKLHNKKNLLTGDYTDERLVVENATVEDIASQTEAPPLIVSYWRPRVHLRLLHDFTVFPASGIPAPLNEHYRFDPRTHKYFPVVYFDYFWLLKEHYIEINETTPTLPLELSYSAVSLLKFQFQMQMQAAWDQQASLGTTEDDTFEFRRMLLETNPYLLAVTIAVSLLHMVFDFLAFKNDIQFWNQERSMEGLSVRSVFLQCFCQVIVFLYLLDNETSWMILLSAGIGLLIEFWKITKVAIVKFDRSKWYMVTVQDKETYAQSPTARYDREAMKYLSWALFPLVVGYSIYSLYYQEHKSWYSWVLSSLTGAVYTFGFIMMCPQLYLNYKLKSVAHLPWRMLTYKALNTFIDDLFAFIIKMPTLHRLSCFRDDVVFFIFLYQRWIYRVDYTRANEFGFRVKTEEEKRQEEEESKKKQAEEKVQEDEKQPLLPPTERTAEPTDEKNATPATASNPPSLLHLLKSSASTAAAQNSNTSETLGSSSTAPEPEPTANEGVRKRRTRKD